MAISIRRLSDVLASADSGRLYRIEVFQQGEDPGGATSALAGARYILRTSDGERVTALDDKRYRLRSGEVLTALSPPGRDS
ncbi:6-phosphofructokinase [Achromobacter spanius]|uniref:6-phosphofructokinase n=1 Tax=Achromobacter spanius TaxID=217203 RepID=UPI003209E3AA